MDTALLFLIVDLIFFVVVAYYFINFKKGLSEDKKGDLEEKKLHEEEMKRDDLRIKEELSDIHEKATLILSQSEKIADELVVELENILGRKNSGSSVGLPSGNDFELELGSLSQKLKNHYVVRIRNLMASVEKFEYQKAHEVQEFAEEQEVLTDKNIQQMRIDELEKVRQRIERYKSEEIALFDKKVKEVIDQAAAEVLGHSLTMNEQNEIILRALEKARADNKI
ncbi:MAG: hypothetical protein Q7T74_01720 [Candidatus Saccharibacteria bacterium]|nr:hypothetical protein [Candidatus Saccharibacteria bacterium]